MGRIRHARAKDECQAWGAAADGVGLRMGNMFRVEGTRGGRGAVGYCMRAV